VDTAGAMLDHDQRVDSAASHSRSAGS
jgi:hypothetical protein